MQTTTIHYLGTDEGAEDRTGDQTSGVPQSVAVTLLKTLTVGVAELAHLIRVDGHCGLHHQNQILTSCFDLAWWTGRPCCLISNQTSPGHTGCHRLVACGKLTILAFPRSLSNQRLPRLLGTKKYFGSHAAQHPISGQQATEYLDLYTPHTLLGKLHVDLVW